MSYGVSFGHKKYGIEMTAPYDHWVQCGRPCGAVFKHSDHFGDDIIKWYLMPAEGVAYIDSYAEFTYAEFRIYAQLSFDESKKMICLERISCERKNYWGDSESDEVKSGSGGIEYYRTNVENLGENFISLEIFVTKFFSGWTVYYKPSTTPQVSHEAMRLAKECPDDYMCGPWGITVGIYHNPVDRVSAATTIQKCFRGWRVRMKTAFDPQTSLGAYYVMRGFDELVPRNGKKCIQ